MVGLALTACGSRAGDTDTGDGASAVESCVDTSGDTIKVGSLNSLSGTMAISEVTVRDSIALAVEEINASGGVNGKQIEVVAEDGASEPTVFAEKAEKLISSDCVAAVFGGWTSSSRKAMLPVFEDNDALLYYPVQYEGLEASENIFYTGATTNQQIIPALDYLKEQGVTSLYLVGSDYVFPQTANREIKAYAEANGIDFASVETAPGQEAKSGAISAIVRQKPDLVILGTGPTETAVIVGQAAAQGYQGQFLGSSPTWNPALLASPAGPVRLAGMTYRVHGAARRSPGHFAITMPSWWRLEQKFTASAHRRLITSKRWRSACTCRFPC